MDRPTLVVVQSNESAGCLSGRRQGATPLDGSIRLANLQMVRLVDEEALGTDDGLEAVRTETLVDPLRRLAGQQRTRMDSGVERSSEALDADVVGEVTEPVAQTVTERVGIEFEVVVLRGHVGGALTTALARHAVHVGRSADDHEISATEHRGRRIVDREDGRLGDRTDPFGDVFGDHMSVAEHRFVDNDNVHDDLFHAWDIPGSEFIVPTVGRGVHGPFGPFLAGTRRRQPLLADHTETMSAITMTTAQLDAHIDRISAAPSQVGTIELVVARPATGERLVLESGELRPGIGLLGDNYLERGSSQPGGGPAHPLAELNLMSARALHAVAGADRDRWPPAGDQLIVDFDLSEANCPAGTRLEVGSAVIEVTTKPHTGCAKFSARYGIEAARWVNSRKDLRLRGVCAVVVEPGAVRPGDTITKH